MAMAVLIELENQTRGVLHFPTVNKDGKETSRVVLGDAADKHVDGERDPLLQPSPVVRLDPAAWHALGERNRKAIDALVARGDIARRDMQVA